jgi:Skp family chaperone for outer membrane proteins
MKAHYTDDVVKYLTTEKIGLSTRYDEWAGQTLMLIPLGNATPGSLSAVDTTPLTDKEVIDEMRKDDDKGIDTRKEMVDLKEREAGEAEKKAQDAAKDADDKEKAIAEEKKQSDKDKDNNSDNAQKKEELDEREQAVADQRKDAEKEQELADKKTAEAQDERNEIAKDQQKLITDEGRDVPVTIIGVIVNSPLSPLGKIVQIDITSGSQVKDAGRTVNTRAIVVINDSIFTLSSQGAGYRLVKLDVKTLDTVEQSDEAISSNSLLWVEGTDLYALLGDGKTSYIARFDTNLKLQAKSSVPVHPFASVLLHKKMIVTTSNNGDALFLNPLDLTEQIAVQK